MTDITSQAIEIELKDAAAEHHETLPLRIVAKEGVVSIYPHGYGDFGSADGHGCPVFLEFYEGRLRIVTFPDINQEEPTIIDLNGAREDRREERSGDLPSERLLNIEYRCPICDHEWQEQWTCACDSECPNCGSKDISALSWDEADQ